MGVYVDDVRHKYKRMVMCHMWADTHDELLAMADKIGVKSKWLQKPPLAGWVHFDICLAKKKLAIQEGAVLTDKYGPIEHLARMMGDTIRLLRIAEMRRNRMDRESERADRVHRANRRKTSGK